MFVPIAVAWDTAEVGKNFAEGNVLGGFLNLAAAAGAGFAGLGGIADSGAAAGGLESSATGWANSFATSLGYVANAAGDLATQLGNTIFEGAAIVGGASGIVQSAESGDGLGIAAGVLEVAAGVAGGLISFGEVSPNLQSVVGTIAACHSRKYLQSVRWTRLRSHPGRSRVGPWLASC